MKKTLSISVIALGLMGMASAANALSFNEAQGTTFEQFLDVTPTIDNRLLLSVSGLNSQFDSLSFAFTGVPGLSVTATNALNPSVKLAAFNDIRNNGFTLLAGTTYQVKISGQTNTSIPGGEGTVSISALNAVVALVPEPETYAMFLAGLGLIGGMARRRKASGG